MYSILVGRIHYFGCLNVWTQWARVGWNIPPICYGSDSVKLIYLWNQELLVAVFCGFVICDLTEQSKRLLACLLCILDGQNTPGLWSERPTSAS